MEDFISQEEFNLEIQSMDKFINKIEMQEGIELLKLADSYNVLFEVVTSAFEHKEAFPKASHLECLQVGAKEWDIGW
jgi:uncharacterized protein YktA (UPF0223 family)